jgi:diacylglycerol O-acyltransferase / wax synthase
LREPVTGADAVWLQDSATNQMVINAVFTVDRIDLETFRRTFRQRVLELGQGQRYPRFRRRITYQRGQPYWEDDPAFDIAHHIVAAPAGAAETMQALQDYVGAEAARPLALDRPRWQFQLVERFENDQSACLIRVHHVMGDGISLVPIIFELMDLDLRASSPGLIQPAGAVKAHDQPGRRLLMAIRAPLAAPGVMIRRLLWPRDRHALHGPKLGGVKRVAWTRPFDLGVVKEVKNRLDATVNDVLMSCVSGAMTRYLAARSGGAPAVAQFRVSMPVNVRPPSEPIEMRNKFAAVPLVLPAGIPDVRARVAAVKAQMDALKRSVEPIVVYGIVTVLLKALPQGASRFLIDFLANKCTAVVTNVPGPQRDLYLAGRRLRSLIFWVPQRADIGVGISILSFSGMVQVGVLADTRVLPDPAELVAAFEEEFAELARL